MKEYKILILWADGSVLDCGTIKTADPKRCLFNRVCELIFLTKEFYDPNNPDKIWDNIWKGKLDRESYHYEANDNVVSIMEA